MKLTFIVGVFERCPELGTNILVEQGGDFSTVEIDDEVAVIL